MKKAFRRAFRADMYLMLHGKLLLACLAVPLLVLLDTAVDVKYAFQGENLSIFYFYFHSISYIGLVASNLIPMLCALPYAASLCDELNTGAWRTSLSRSDTRSYLLSRFVVSVLSGALVFGAGIALLFVGLRPWLPIFTRSDIHFLTGFFYGQLVKSSPWAYVLVAVLYACYTGAICAAFATAVSAFTSSKNAVIVSPFVFTFVSTRVEVLANVPNQYRPMMWLNMGVCISGEPGNELGTFIACALFTAAFLCAAGAVFLKRGRGKLMNA